MNTARLRAPPHRHHQRRGNDAATLVIADDGDSDRHAIVQTCLVANVVHGKLIVR